MSIYSLTTAKTLKKTGKALGRELIAKRVLYCVTKMLKDQHYQGVMEFVGRMKAISQACNFDTYWSEKVGHGFSKEVEDLRLLAALKKNHYYGYNGLRDEEYI